jgi:hypothetical protein
LRVIPQSIRRAGGGGTEAVKSWLLNGVWLFAGMTAYGPKWWALAALACWVTHAALIEREGRKP